MDPDKALAAGRAQNEGTEPGGGASPGGGAGSSGAGAGTGATPTAQPQYVGAPPVSVYGAAAPPNEYTWSLGGTFYGAGTAIGREGAYASGGAGFRLHADYIAVPALKLGAQAFVGVTTVAGETVDDIGTFADLNIIDFGLAGFKHFCMSRLCLTPLAGVMISGMQPSYDDDDSVNMFTVGGRLEAAAAVSLGSRYEHVISAALGANVYSPAVGDYEDEPAFYGLDEASTAVYFGVGYTYRFNTPLGQSPFITFD
jgi:hypothetical protein